MVRRYAGSVPDDFRFTIKTPNAITLTHPYARQPKGSERSVDEPNPHFLSVDLLHRFLEVLEPMHGKLGPVMFQFEYLNKQKMPSLSAFLDRLHGFWRSCGISDPSSLSRREHSMPATIPVAWWNLSLS